MAARQAKEELTLFEELQKEVNVPGPLVVTQDITLVAPTKAQLDASKAALTEDESNKLLLGEEIFDKLQDLFANEAPQLWEAFNKAYIDHFFPTQSE